jgi:hypothetical protein
MSYDLVVFEAATAPRTREAFLDWWDGEPQWSESHLYNNANIPSPTLRAWFQEMIRTFPPLNGPMASDNPDDPKVTDYNVGRSVINASFGWSQAEAAQRHTMELAAKHRVGVFEVSSEESEIWLPTKTGRLELLKA